MRRQGDEKERKMSEKEKMLRELLKGELKDLLKDHLDITAWAVSSVDDYGIRRVEVNVEVRFDEEIVTSCGPGAASVE
jgi:hypothetical protein